MTNPLFERYGGLIRIILYFVFLLWATLLFFLCIARLNYTSNFRDEPSLNGGLPFYDPCVVELLVAAITGMAFAIFILYRLRERKASAPLTRNWFEVLCLAILWLLWLGGAAAASTVWPDLSWCIAYSPCVVLQVLMAWAWLGWITLTLLLSPTLFVVVKNGSWDSPYFDAWGQRHLRRDIEELNRFRKSYTPRVPPKESFNRGKGPETTISEF